MSDGGVGKRAGAGVGHVERGCEVTSRRVDTHSYYSSSVQRHGNLPVMAHARLLPLTRTVDSRTRS